MILTNARIITFDSTHRILNSGSVEIEDDGVIVAVSGASPAPSSQTIDLHGKLLMPALINCHTRLYGTLARGISLPGHPPRNFEEILRHRWWRLDRALDEEDVYLSALTGLIDSAKCGVGTVVDHHSSPSACAGSLDVIAKAFNEVGLRGALCYETSDRNGVLDTEAAIRENVRFIERLRQSNHDTLAACFGLHAAFTLSDRTIGACAEANHSLGTGFHIHVAEDAVDVGAVQRLAAAGILDERTLAAHCVHVNVSEMNILARLGVSVVHNPQSNCHNAVGVQKLLELLREGVLVGLGSDGYSPCLWDEFKTAFHLQKLQANDPRVAHAEVYAAFLNNGKIAHKIWGWNIGRIETGAKADLMIVDYYPPTPLQADTLFEHLLFGIANAPVDSLIVNGKYVLRNRQMITVDEKSVAERARKQAQKLWSRFEELT